MMNELNESKFEFLRDENWEQREGIISILFAEYKVKAKTNYRFNYLTPAES